MKKRKVLIVPDELKDNAGIMGFEVEKWLHDHSVATTRAFSEKSNFAVLLGGDGFIMRKSLELGRAGIPFLAINFGQKGFLAVAEKDDWHDVLGKVLNGRYAIEKRPILAVTRFNGANVVSNFEVAGNVYIRHRAYLIEFTGSIDGKVVYDRVGADGVIVANATGATAYNLAAKGPLISSGLVFTPICPHRLDVVPFPVPESAKVIEIIYRGRNGLQPDDEGCLLFSDSDKKDISPGERLEIRKSGKEVALIIQEGFSFIESLQKKLGAYHGKEEA